MNDLEVTRALSRSAVAALDAARQRIDDLNVYPVPDGDTGTNMALTSRAVVEALEASQATDRPSLARECTRAALLGARGNSGVILSQIVRGAAEVLGGTEGPIDPPLLARALRGAADAAYAAVREPAEGTILTVARELAEEAEGVDPSAHLDELVLAVVRRGERSLASTPEHLAVLREAGVVDAGGAGLLELVRGFASGVRGEPVPESAAPEHGVSLDALHQELSRYRYCTGFVVEGEGLDAAALEHRLERLGDSLLVVGDLKALKVHLHTDEPGAALAAGTAIGVVDRVEIANMHAQTLAREERLRAGTAGTATATCGVVAVAAGEGNRRILESLGAALVVEGGQTMNPSAAELVAAAERTDAVEIVLLPNNPNVILTAQQAATLASKPLRVVRSDSIQRGVAAMVAFDPSHSAAKNAEAMTEAIGGVATGEVTVASRDAQLDGLLVRKGSYLGLADGEPVASGASFEQVTRAVVDRLLAEPRSLVTFLTGAEEPELETLLAELSERHPLLELDVQVGGQPHYPVLISAE